MKRSWIFSCMMLVCTLFFLCVSGSVQMAAEASVADGTNEAAFSDGGNTILEGIFIGEVEVGGLTKEEAENAVAVYLRELDDTTFILLIEDELGRGEKSIKLSDMDARWANPEVIDEVAELAKKGNVIKRYKERKDLENNPCEFNIKLRVDRDRLTDFLKETLKEFEVTAVNADISLPGKNAEFIITEGHDGRAVLYDEMTATLVDYVENEWDFTDGIQLQVLTEPVPAAYKSDSLRLIQRKAMGSFSTTFKSSSKERSANIKNAASKINGKVIYPGEEFSTLNCVTPFNAENGYFEAGSYFAGKLTDSFGGGVCQVASTLYNAVLWAELEVTKRNNHGLTVEYVQLAADAAIAESSGLDFCFKNNTQVPVLISAYVEDRTLTIELFGYDLRPAERTIKYVHEILEEYEPGEDVYEDDPELPKGVTEIKQAAHKGYKAVLYKNVYVNGSLTERIKVNESVYRAAPKYVAVGTKDTEE